MTDLVLRGGTVVGGNGAPVRSDVYVGDGRISAVLAHTQGPPSPDIQEIDCTGRLVLPGFIDTHSHADAAVFDTDVQRALLSDGITTVVAGQDGVSFAPGDGRYGTEYFGGINGAHPYYAGGGVAELLDSYHLRVPINVAYLVPHGTVRHQVMGWSDAAADSAQLAQMVALVADGLGQGAVGFSSGLDYVPGQFADAAELTALCAPVAAAGAVYVTHMRGGYEHNARAGVDEVRQICAQSGVRGHISHYHGPAELLLELIEDSAEHRADITFDAYPYRAGCSLLAMPLLPAELLRRGPAVAMETLADPAYRAKLFADWFPRIADLPYLGDGWSDRLTLANVPAAKYDWAGGLSLQAAARQAGTTVAEFAVDLLIATELTATVVMPLPPGRSVDELAALVAHPAHMVGTDGIYLGSHPHPRGWGTFARLLGRHVRERGDLSWQGAAEHLSGHPARRFGLGARGQVKVDQVADLVVVDPGTVTDLATYAQPRQTSRGIEDVVVAGQVVLRSGQLTGVNSGTGLRRST